MASSAPRSLVSNPAAVGQDLALRELAPDHHVARHEAFLRADGTTSADVV